MTYRYPLFLLALIAPSLCWPSPILVPPYTVGGFASTSFIGTPPNYVTDNVNFVALPPPSSQGGSGETAALLTYGVVLTPQPSITATGSVSSNNFFEGASANLLLELDYYLVASGPGPFVTVDVSGFGNSSFPGESFLGVQAPPGFAPINISSPLTTAWTLNTSFSALTGLAYLVRMEVQISLGSAGDGLLTQTAFVDPIFTIDPSFPDAGLYSLDFSPGIGNGDVASVATPEPSYAGLVAAALVLCLAGKRARIMM